MLQVKNTDLSITSEITLNCNKMNFDELIAQLDQNILNKCKMTYENIDSVLNGCLNFICETSLQPVNEEVFNIDYVRNRKTQIHEAFYMGDMKDFTEGGKYYNSSMMYWENPPWCFAKGLTDDYNRLWSLFDSKRDGLYKFHLNDINVEVRVENDEVIEVSSYLMKHCVKPNNIIPQMSLFYLFWSLQILPSMGKPIYKLMRNLSKVFWTNYDQISKSREDECTI